MTDVPLAFAERRPKLAQRDTSKGAPVTVPPSGHALIVAHGQPSDPAPAEVELAAIAAAVAAHLPGWHVASATLADPSALARAITNPTGFVYPMFMSAGWFTATHLPDRLAAAGGADWQLLTPFGLDREVQSLAVTLALNATRGQSRPEVLLAAHGSFRSIAPSSVAYEVTRQMLQAGFVRAEAGFIDQSPRIAEVAQNFGPDAVCLPFFAARGGHVTDDLPQALAAAGFRGRILPPVGLDPRVPGVIARTLQSAARYAPASAGDG